MDGDRIYVPREDVPRILSLARSMQEMGSRGELETRVDQRLLREYNGEGVPEEAIYELGRDSFDLDASYVQRALQLCSGSAQETIEILKEMGVSPSGDLVEQGRKEIAKTHRDLVLRFLNGEEVKSNAPIWFKSLKQNRNYLLGFDLERKNRIRRMLEKPLGINERAFGVVSFLGDESLDVSMKAYTIPSLALFSGPIREITSQISELSLKEIVFDPKERIKVSLPGNGGYGYIETYKVGDPF